jgi:hypothetical protein
MRRRKKMENKKKKERMNKKVSVSEQRRRLQSRYPEGNTNPRSRLGLHLNPPRGLTLTPRKTMASDLEKPRNPKHHLLDLEDHHQSVQRLRRRPNPADRLHPNQLLQAVGRQEGRPLPSSKQVITLHDYLTVNNATVKIRA